LLLVHLFAEGADLLRPFRPRQKFEGTHGSSLGQILIMDSMTPAHRNLDGCVEVEASYYSAPPRWIGPSAGAMDVRSKFACSTKTGELLREHLRQERGRHRIHDEDLPKRTPVGTLELLRGPERPANRSAPSANRCTSSKAHRGAPHSSVLSSSKSTRARVEEACAMAMKWKSTVTRLCAATWSATHSHREFAAG